MVFVIFEVVAGPERRKVSTLEELVLWQGDSFHIDEIIGLAQFLDRTIKKPADLRLILVREGFIIMRDGRRHLAVRESEKECVRCYQLLPEMDGVAV